MSNVTFSVIMEFASLFSNTGIPCPIVSGNRNFLLYDLLCMMPTNYSTAVRLS